MGSPDAIISEMKETVQNTRLRAVDTISGCYGAENDMCELMEIEKLYNSEDDLGGLRKKKIIWGISET